MHSATNFPKEVNSATHLLEYGQRYELGQGGPLNSEVKIDGVLLKKLYFGGPAISYDDQFYLPLWEPPMFYPAIIRPSTREIMIAKKGYPVVIFTKASETQAEFYTDILMTKLATIEASEFRLLRKY